MKLSNKEFDRLQLGEEDDKDKADVWEYIQLVGNILWVASMTRPDIAYYASRLAMYAQCPTKQHEYFALCVVGYLVKTKEMVLTYGGKLRTPMGTETRPEGFEESSGLHTIHDSSWGKDIHPFGGYAIMLNNGAVLCAAPKLRIVPDSTAEAETAIASRAAKDTVAVRTVLEDLHIGVYRRTAMLGTVELAKISSRKLAARNVRATLIEQPCW